jgi:catechol 2,3-dioxygenase-like lactoylglutathione lyase family enzyme
MISGLTHVTVLVRDQDEALRFYTEKLGFEKRADMSFGPGMRWLSVAPQGQTDLEIVLQQPNPAMHGEEHARQMAEMVGRGTTWVFACDNCRATAAALREHGVEFQSEPQEQPYGVEAVFVDLYGNSYSLLEPRPMPGLGAPDDDQQTKETPATGADWAAQRAELLGAMRAGNTAMAELMDQLDEARLTESGATGHWSAKDVLAHIAFGNDWLAGELERAARGDAPPTTAEIQKMRDEGWFDDEFVNTTCYNENKDRPLSGIRDWWATSTERLAAAIEAAPEAVLAAPDWWTGDRLVGKALWVSHEGEHAQELRAWAANQQ